MSTLPANSETVMDALRYMAHIARTQSDFGEALNVFMRRLIEFYGAQRGLLASVQEDVWQVETADGFSEAELAQAASASDLFAQILLSETGLVPEVALTPDYQAVGLPLVVQGRTVGVVYLERSALPFSPSDLEQLQLLSAQAALALANMELERALKQAEQSKSKFVSVVSHELRLPMTSIKGYADLMRQGAIGPVSEMQVNFLDVIRSNVDRMSTLISDLSDISKLETGRLRLDCKAIPLSRPVSEVLMTAKPKLAEKEQNLVLDIPEDLAQVYADSSRVKQILMNLVTNSRLYMAAGGEVRISARQQNDFIQVSVQDSGAGISADDQVKIFSPFFRSDDAVIREHPGWGLSLHVSKLLVELMGGEMGFESQLGQGSTFWFTLPLS